MREIVFAIALAASAFPAVDADRQPECRERCEEAYAQALAACDRLPEGMQADQCRDGADERHQECTDRCNE